MDDDLINFGGRKVEAIVVGNLYLRGGGLVVVDLANPMVETLFGFLLIHFDELFTVAF